MTIRNAVLACVALAAAAQAGKLDLDLQGATPPIFGRAAAPAPQTALTDWRPGDPRDARGESKTVQVIAGGGYAAMGAVAAAQTAHGGVHGREAKAETAGFIALAAIGVWRFISALWN
jgi:hypothetical protein